jgi:acyl-CoA reductase-like NAD-dependent aldehyde dehydrogenase
MTRWVVSTENNPQGAPAMEHKLWINDHLPLTSETPHGGFKQSGFGKDLSAEAIGDYQITKHVMVAQ